MKHGVRRFFKYARERHQIYLNRQKGLPREQWTADPILQQYRFTNVFRELDKTTQWFAKHVREPLRDSPDVLLATVVFRLLNRIETGESVFCDNDLLDKSSAFYNFMRTGHTGLMKQAILHRQGRGPYVTGAYIISSPAGYSKLDGMMEVLHRFYQQPQPVKFHSLLVTAGWQNVADCLTVKNHNVSMESVFDWLKQFDYLGKFHSYEIVTDLRYTSLLERAPDRMTWCNVGPGARRGLNRVMGRDYKDHGTSTQDMIYEMQELLSWAHHQECWPTRFPKWEMREVEHTLCEFDKYERVKLGQGKPRGVYR